MKYQYIIAIYLIAINLLAYILYAIDKYKSKRQKWRISEKVLIMVALFGGSIGALFSMKMFHHKTKHKKFTIVVPLILIAQVVLFYILIRN